MIAAELVRTDYSMLLQFLLLLISLPYSIFQDNFNCQRCGTSDAGTAICKTDEYCQFFNDCCCEDMSSDESEKLSLSLLNSTAEFTCQSTFTDPDLQVIAENEAFLMISSCPGSWVDPENSTIENSCIQPSPPLPPATDTSTGLVYRNEYCALCHNVAVNDTLWWTISLVCHEIILTLIENDMLSEEMQNNQSLLGEQCNVCKFLPPHYTFFKRSCIPNVDSCLPVSSLHTVAYENVSESAYEDLVRNCTTGEVHLIYVNGTTYRNRACATCNGQPQKNVSCFELKQRREQDICKMLILRVPPPVFVTEAPIWSHITLRTATVVTLTDLGSGKTEVASGDESTELDISCPEGEVLTATLQCTSAGCPEGYSVKDGRCTKSLKNSTVLLNCTQPQVLVDNTSYIDLLDDTVVLSETSLTIEVLDYDELGHPIICLDNNDTSYLNCNSTFVKLNQDDYMDLLNGSILFQNRVLDVMFNDSEDGLPLVCYDLIRPTTRLLFVEDLPGLQELTYIGCSLSVFGTVAVIFTYLVFKELQTFPGLVLVNVCVPLFFTSLIFIIGGPVLQSYPIKELCSTFAIFLHYFYLSQFSWMTIFSFETTKTFYQARRLIQNTKQTKYKYFLSYFLISWISPLIICTTTTVLNFTTGLVRYGVNGRGEFTCWINHYEFLIASFLLPLVFSLTGNLLFLVITSVLLYRAYKDQSKVGKSNMATMIRVWLALFTITGLTWIFGFLALINEISWMWYFFTIFNSTQGFSVFLSFIVTKKMWHLYKGLFKNLKDIITFSTSLFGGDSLEEGKEQPQT